MKILFTGGGTAGHVTPNVALIEVMQAAGHNCHYVGSRAGIENELITGIPFYSISSGKLRRYFSWQNFVDPFRVVWALLESLFLIARIRPDVVFSKGGFLAVPVVLAAWLLRVPVICHESDVTPGLANKISFPFTDTICVNFAETAALVSRDQVVVTGTPLRTSLLKGCASRGRRFLGFAEDKPVLLIFGGSLGATRINAQVRSVIGLLSERYAVIHITGAGNIDESLLAMPGYVQKAFLNEEFGDVLAAANLVIARAGANTIYELLALRKPHILIPLSGTASRGDQLVNARIFEKGGFSVVIQETELSDELFIERIAKTFERIPDLTAKLSRYEIPDSTQMIKELLTRTAEKRYEKV